MATFVADNKEDADRVQELFNEVRLQNEKPNSFSPRTFYPSSFYPNMLFCFCPKTHSYLFVTILTEPMSHTRTISQQLFT